MGWSPRCLDLLKVGDTTSLCWSYQNLREKCYSPPLIVSCMVTKLTHWDHGYYPRLEVQINHQACGCGTNEWGLYVYQWSMASRLLLLCSHILNMFLLKECSTLLLQSNSWCAQLCQICTIVCTPIKCLSILVLPLQPWNSIVPCMCERMSKHSIAQIFWTSSHII